MCEPLFEGYECEDCDHNDRNCETCDGYGLILHCIECGREFDSLKEAQSEMVHVVPENQWQQEWRCRECDAEFRLAAINERRAAIVEAHTERGAA